MSVLDGNGDGTFGPQTTYSTLGDPSSVATADLNDDGYVDIVVGDYDNGLVSVLINNGDGTFAGAVQYSANSGYGLNGIAIADVNGDGIPDIIATNTSDNDVSVLLGVGDGSFQPGITYAAGAGASSVAVADLNGDGKPDLIVANYNDNDVSVLLGNGDGTFAEQATYATDQGPKTVAVADLNGDGKVDIVTANISGDSISVLLGNGNGTFEAENSVSAGGHANSLAIGDVNGDGVPDVVVASYNASDVILLLGNGDGSFQSPTAENLGGSHPEDVAVGDVNGDGRTDIVATGYNTATLQVLLNNGNGNFTGPVYTINHVAPVVTGIARDSALSTNATSVSFSVSFSEAVTGVTPAAFSVVTSGTVGYTLTQISPTTASLYEVTISGITGNGNIGLNLTNSAGIFDAAGNPLSQANATASFSAATAVNTIAALYAVQVADLNNDGKADLVAADYDNGTVDVMLGNAMEPSAR